MKRLRITLLLYFTIFFTVSCNSLEYSQISGYENTPSDESSLENNETQKSELLKNQNNKKDKIIIGATLASESSYLESVSVYMKEAAKEKDIVLELVYADWDAEIQTNQINNFIQKRVDAIIICPINAKSLEFP